MGQDPVVQGNAHREGRDHGSWFLGHFVAQPEGHLRRSREVEVQLRVHVEGNRKPGWTRSRHARTLVLLVRGRFVLEFPDREVVLEEEGDYVLWAPGVAHSWRAEAETLVVTVRWPSIPEDPEPVPSP